MSCAVGHRCGSDPVSLWLWCRLATAALLRPLTWELPYATGADLKSGKKEKKEEEEEEDKEKHQDLFDQDLVSR